MKVRVVLPSSNKTLTLSVEPTSTVRKLKDEICAEEKIDKTKFQLRVIFAGRLLEDDASLSDSKVSEASILHCQVSERLKDHERRGPPTETTTDVDSNGNTVIVIPSDRRGEDALREAGLTDDEIAAIRLHYFMNSDGGEGGGAGGDGGGEDVETIILRRSASGEDFAVFRDDEFDEVDEVGDFSDLLWGMALGFLLGIIMVFLSFDRHITLSRRWRLGIIIGKHALLRLHREHPHSLRSTLFVT